MSNINTSIAAAVPLMQAKSRINLSYQHMENAIYLMRQSETLEVFNNGKTFGDGDFVAHHRAYVVGAIMASIASVEARINELYLDATDHLLGSFIDDKQEKLLADLWPTLDEKKFSILDKYQIFLTSISKEKFDTSRDPFQSLNLLIDLRNMLVHYKPEWDNSQKKHRGIYDKLRGKFKLNPFFPKDDPIFFPLKCLSYGCARWAVESSMKFILDFMSNIGAEKHQSYEIWKKLAP